MPRKRGTKVSISQDVKKFLEPTHSVKSFIKATIQTHEDDQVTSGVLEGRLSHRGDYGQTDLRTGSTVSEKGALPFPEELGFLKDGPVLHSQDQTSSFLLAVVVKEK
ncbi:UNVERIFIED_CONTAM: hypothetical protein K2H54_054468 [Gekko kuhli]